MVRKKVIPQVSGRDAKIATIDGPAGQFYVATVLMNKEHRDKYHRRQRAVGVRVGQP
jgi:hypothetical protein